MKPTTGIEPVNLILTKDVLYLLSYVGFDSCAFRHRKAYIFPIGAIGGHLGNSTEQKDGAGNGTRTRDPQLGRLTL